MQSIEAVFIVAVLRGLDPFIVGWSEIFENVHNSADQIYFIQIKKNRKFYLSKITETLKKKKIK